MTMPKIPTWKKYLSYIKDIHVETRSSEYNPDLYVDISQGRYRLLTPGAIYSHEDLYENFGKIFKKDLELPSKEISTVLVLGLGLGSIPLILDQMRPGKWDFTAVDIDEEVCDLANIYGLSQLISPIQTITTDAAIFVDITSEQYDMICVDLFVGDKTPQKFLSAKFLKKLKSLLEPEGIIIYNTLAYNKSDKKISEEFFTGVFKKVFQDALSIYSHRNNMLLSHRHWLRR